MHQIAWVAPTLLKYLWQVALVNAKSAPLEHQSHHYTSNHDRDPTEAVYRSTTPSRLN